MQNLFFHSKPKTYGLIYLLCIPCFGFIFFILPETIGKETSLVESMYFSTVTITTLGYGDISPMNNLGRVVAATESVLGIILIGLFLNAISRVRGETSKDEEIEKEKKSYYDSEIAKLNGFYSLINPLIKKYRLSVVPVTNPLSTENRVYNPNFNLNDMKDLYGSTLLLTHNFHEPAVKYYFSSMKLLGREIVDLIKNVDMRLFPELEKHCLSFVEAMYTFDFSDAILSAVHTTLGDKKMTDHVKEMLDSHEGEVEFKDSNAINAYVALYYQIKLQMDLLEKIDTEFTEILNANKSKQCH